MYNDYKTNIYVMSPDQLTDFVHNTAKPGGMHKQRYSENTKLTVDIPMLGTKRCEY